MFVVKMMHSKSMNDKAKEEVRLYLYPPLWEGQNDIWHGMAWHGSHSLSTSLNLLMCSR